MNFKNYGSFSFGIGRNYMKNLIFRTIPDMISPGPGKYFSLLNPVGKDAFKYSLKGRIFTSKLKRAEY